MTWYHYSSCEDIQLKNVKQIKNSAGKPCGFWLSYNDEWLNWCKDQEFYTFNRDSYYIYEYCLDTLNMCKISSISDLHTFTDKYSIGKEFSMRIDWGKSSTRIRRFSRK